MPQPASGMRSCYAVTNDPVARIQPVRTGSGEAYRLSAPISKPLAEDVRRNAQASLCRRSYSVSGFCCQGAKQREPSMEAGLPNLLRQRLLLPRCKASTGQGTDDNPNHQRTG